MKIQLRDRHGTVRAEAVCDEDDAERIAGRWHLDRCGYAVQSRYLGGGRRKPKWATMRLARVLLGLAKGDPREADHINGDRLDNRRANLRIVTHAENTQNRPARMNSSSGIRGVSYHKRLGKWQAYGALNGKTEYLGIFKSKTEAGEVASAWRKKNLPFSVEERRVDFSAV